MKLLTLRSLLLAIAGGLFLCIFVLGVRSTQLLHPSTWDPKLPAWSSDSVEVPAWGWPLYCAVDHPWRGRIGRLELSELVLDRMAANWLFFTLLVLYGRGLWAAFSRRGVVPQPLAVADLLAPMSVFLVVQSLLPWFAADWWNEPAIGTVFRQSTLLALLVTLAAYLLMLGVGLPLAWLLDRWTCPGCVDSYGFEIVTSVTPAGVGGAGAGSVSEQRQPSGGPAAGIAAAATTCGRRSNSSGLR